MAELTREQWEDATNQWVLVIIWNPKSHYKKQRPSLRVAGDYPTYAKAMAAKRKIERENTTAYHAPDRRTVYVARRFDVNKLDLFDSFIIRETEQDNGN